MWHEASDSAGVNDLQRRNALQKLRMNVLFGLFLVTWASSRGLAESTSVRWMSPDVAIVTVKTLHVVIYSTENWKSVYSFCLTFDKEVHSLLFNTNSGVKATSRVMYEDGKMFAPKYVCNTFYLSKLDTIVLFCVTSSDAARLFAVQTSALRRYASADPTNVRAPFSWSLRRYQITTSAASLLLFYRALSFKWSKNIPYLPA